MGLIFHIEYIKPQQFLVFGPFEDILDSHDALIVSTVTDVIGLHKRVNAIELLSPLVQNSLRVLFQYLNPLLNISKLLIRDISDPIPNLFKKCLLLVTLKFFTQLNVLSKVVKKRVRDVLFLD